IVVVHQANARPVRLDNELLLRRPHLMDPAGESRLRGNVLKDHPPFVDKSPRRDRPLQFVVDWFCRHARGNSAHAASLWRLLRLLCSATAERDEHGDGNTANQATKTQIVSSGMSRF